MAVHFFSDLHLSGPGDPLYARFLKTLDQIPSTGDVVVLAGDVFDLFVGNRSVFKNLYREFFQTLSRLEARGVDVHYIEGNHDFHLAKALAPHSRVRLHSESVTLEIDGKRFYVAHGDLVDQEDEAYLRLRAFLRSAPLRTFVALAPERWILAIARKLNRVSQAQNVRQPVELGAPARDRLRHVYRTFARSKFEQGYDFVLLGHCHDIDDASFKSGGREGHYMNIGYPRVDPRFVTWTQGDTNLRRVEYLTAIAS